MGNEDILRSMGFVLIRKRGLWVSHELRMAFSYEALQDNDQTWLRRRLNERVPPTDFVFHYSQRYPEDLQECTKILNEIGLPGLTPYVRVATLSVG